MHLYVRSHVIFSVDRLEEIGQVPFTSQFLMLSALLWNATVELRSKGPGRKGNPPIRERISGPINHFLIYFYIDYKRISVYGKNKVSPLKSLGAKFHYSFQTIPISETS